MLNRITARVNRISAMTKILTFSLPSLLARVNVTIQHWSKLALGKHLELETGGLRFLQRAEERLN
jgi:hypothetical protein